TGGKLDHKEAWEAQAGLMRSNLEEVLHLPESGKVTGKLGKPELKDGISHLSLTLAVEKGLDLSVHIRRRKLTGGSIGPGRRRPCLLLHLDGKSKALEHPIASELVVSDWEVFAPDLRATGEAKPMNDGIRTAPDHNSTEHALLIGRPLLGQW